MIRKLTDIYKGVMTRQIKKRLDLPSNVVLGYPVYIEGDVKIGPGTYVNSNTHIVAGPNKKIRIGKECMISYNVHIRGRMHNPLNIKTIVEGDIIIGNKVWISANSIIREGITIGDGAIVGGNSVVTTDVEANTIVGGVPARVISK